MPTTRILGEDFLQPLHRHFINLMCIDSGAAAQEKHGAPAIYNFSAFVVEIQGQWIVISAGHIFKELLKAIEGGGIISNWQIDDSITSTKPMPPYPISLDIMKDVLFLYNDISGIDYACFQLNHLATQALSKEGIKPIPELAWSTDDFQNYSFWLLVGTPEELTTLKLGESFIKNHATVRLERLYERPKNWPETEFQRLYARIDFDSVIHTDDSFNIEGMSGGPIFGLKPNLDNSDYRLIGVQSSWKRSERIVAICAAQPFIKSIKMILERGNHHDGDQNQG